MKDQLTVLIPTSPIPSHPSTAILDETIANVRKYTDAKIIIMVDGIHSSLEHRRPSYTAYRDAVAIKMMRGDYGDCQIYNFEKHTHQAGMTKFILNKIDTPLIMFVEHDTSPIGEIPFHSLCNAVLNSNNINYVRFNIFDKIPKEHEYLMLGETEIIRIEEDGVEHRHKLQRTIQWSQRPHIAKTSLYRYILNTYFPNTVSMIEDVMHSVVQVQYGEKGFDTFGLAIYTPEGNQLRSYHSDGRGQDEKIVEG